MLIHDPLTYLNFIINRGEIFICFFRKKTWLTRMAHTLACTLARWLALWRACRLAWLAVARWLAWPAVACWLARLAVACWLAWLAVAIWLAWLAVSQDLLTTFNLYNVGKVIKFFKWYKSIFGNNFCKQGRPLRFRLTSFPVPYWGFSITYTLPF